MLRLLQSILGSDRDPASAHSPELITRALERAVDATDSRVRALSGYQKKLRPAVVHAVDHVFELVDGLPAPLDITRSCGTDPELTAWFASPEHLHEVLERDATLGEWRNSCAASSASRVVMLLIMRLEERHVLGLALQGDAVQADVAQTRVSFDGHRFLDPSGAEDETRRLLKHRAYDHLLTLALSRIAGAAEARSELTRERDLLRRKRAAMAGGSWGFEAAPARPLGPADLERRLEEVESELARLGVGSGLLPAHLDTLVEVLSHAENYLWAARTRLVVDRMGVKQLQATAFAPEIELTMLHSAVGQSHVVRLVAMDCEALPQKRDLLREAARYLG